MTKRPQYAERQKRDHVNLKEKEYAIYAAKGAGDTAEASSNAYTDAKIAALPPIPSPANPTATAKDTAVNGSATTYMRSDAAPAIQKTSSSQFGVVKIDGTSITETGGVISATPGGSVKPGLAALISGWPVNLSGNQ